jgi:NADP-dependent alcohol dehydrogenase
VYFEDEPFKILYCDSDKINQSMPIGTVLTLPATGSEMNSGGVICHLDGKYGFGNPHLYPRFSFLDPSVTFTLPRKQVSNGVVDAFVHVMEQYMVENAGARVQDRHSEGILLTLREIGLLTVNEPENYEARANLMWAATNALNGWIGLGQTQDWMTHSIGHELTAQYNMDHGQTLAVILPSLLFELRESRKEKLLQFATRVFNITEGTDEERVIEGINQMSAFFESVGLKTKMSDLGYDESFIKIIATRCDNHGLMPWFLQNQVTSEVLNRILSGAL